MSPCAVRCASFRSIFDPPKLKLELDKLEALTLDPAFWNNPENSQKAMRERKRLEESLSIDTDLARRVEEILAYLELAGEGEQVDDDIQREIGGLRECGGEAGDRDAAERRTRPQQRYCDHPSGRRRHRESQDWAEMLLRMFLRWCERKGFATVINDLQPGDEAGIKSRDVQRHAANLPMAC